MERQQEMARLRMWKAAVVAGTGLTGILAAGLMPAQAAVAPGWRVAAVVGARTDVTHPQPLGAAGNYPGMVTTGRHDAWSLWSTCTQSHRCARVLEHWNGSKWSARRPAMLQKLAAPAGLGASSASDLWVIGGKRTNNAAVHWNGRAWSRRPVPSWVVRASQAGDEPVSVAAFGSSDVWVFSFAGRPASLARAAARYNGHRWVKMHLPGVPVAVSAISRTDMWIAGLSASHPGRSVLMHWNGRSWRTRTIPASLAPAGSQLFASQVTATGSRAAWVQVSADDPGAGTSSQFLAHWNGKAWQHVAEPAKALSLADLTVDGRGGVWAAGENSGGTWAFYHHAAGHWIASAVPVPSRAALDAPAAIAHVPGTTSVLAAGQAHPVSGPGSGQGEVGVLWQFRR
jgi:hypothetical protein